MTEINRVAVGHVPQRTCVACRGKKNKRELVRLVRGIDGAVTVDTSGKLPGRGVYLCPTRQCWEKGLGGGRVGHSLKTRLTGENQRQIVDSLEALVKDNRES